MAERSLEYHLATPAGSISPRFLNKNVAQNMLVRRAFCPLILRRRVRFSLLVLWHLVWSSNVSVPMIRAKPVTAGGQLAAGRAVKKGFSSNSGSAVRICLDLPGGLRRSPCHPHMVKPSRATLCAARSACTHLHRPFLCRCAREHHCMQ